MLLETFRNRFFRTLLTGLLLLALFPICSAYAYEGGDGGSHNIGGSYPVFGTVWYGPKDYTGSDNNVHYRYGVVANTKYDAAIYSCMGSDFDWDDLSNTKKGKLLNDSGFTTFANLFKVGKPELSEDWSSDSAIVLAWNSARELYGETYCYSVNYRYEQKIAAVNAIRRILAEEDNPSGGGSDSGIEYGDYILYKMDPYKSGANYDVEYFAISKSAFAQTIQPALDADENNALYLYATNYKSNALSYFIIVTDKTKSKYSNGEALETSSGSFKTSNYSFVATDDVKAYIDFDLNISKSTLVTMGSYKNVHRLDSFGWNYTNTSFGKDGYAYFFNDDIVYKYDGNDTALPDPDPDPDPEPPTDWPDPPTNVTTEPPDVPSPGDPTVPTPPDPVNPTPGNPWIPIPDDDIDITGQDFQDLIDALNEHCLHLQQSIQSNVSQLWNLQSDFLESQFGDLFDMLGSNFQWLGTDVIVGSFGDLKTYLHELFEWLAERMDFNISVEGGQYDDTSVIYWLKRIWSKMGEGINTQPTDPVQESDDWWAWLLALMGNFVAMLLAFGADKLGDVTNAVQTLAGKFPFCLPWDLAAMFALLDATPVIPSFDLPCFALTSNGLSQVGQYHITLEAFDGVWEGIRWVERLGFVVMLIRYTDKLMAVMRRAVGR